MHRSLDWESAYSYDELKRQELDVARNQLVVKSNALIQRSRFNLSELEQKMLMFLVSKIKPGDSGLDSYYFSFQEFSKVCGIDLQGGRDYRYLRDTLQKLSDKSIWIESEWDWEGKHYAGKSLVRWINDIDVSEAASALWIKFHEKMLPYLFRLRDRYTQYQLRHVLVMNSSYAAALYELLKSYEYLDRPIDFSLDELKIELGVEKIESYKIYQCFKQRVLEIAIREINTFTDLDVQYLPMKTGRKVTRILFSYRKKNTESLNRALVNQDIRFLSKNKKSSNSELPGQLVLIDFQ